MILKHKIRCHGPNWGSSEEKFHTEEKGLIGYRTYYFEQKKTFITFNFSDTYYTQYFTKIEDCSFWKGCDEMSFFRKKYNL